MPINDGANNQFQDSYLVGAQIIFNSTEKLCIFTKSLTDGKTFKPKANDTLDLYLKSGRELYILASENPMDKELDPSIQKVMTEVFFNPEQNDVRILSDEGRQIMEDAFQDNKPQYFYVSNTSHLGIDNKLKSEAGHFGHHTGNGPVLQSLFDQAFATSEPVMKQAQHNSLTA